MPMRAAYEVYEALSLLGMYDIDKPKMRVGNERDGAYIMVEPESCQDIISFGISDNVTFEKEMAQRGHRSFMFDHTIESLPEQNDMFFWKKQGICSEPGAIDQCRTLQEHLAAIPDLTERLVLKIDVEGHEWGVFWKTDPKTLARFDQILVEFHWLRFLDQPGFRHNFKAALSNINGLFTPFHVHANNCAGEMFVEGLPVADVIEISYIKTALVNRSPSKTLYPTSLNMGNRGDKYDYPLLFYPFLPTTISNNQISDLMNKIEADLDKNEAVI